MEEYFVGTEGGELSFMESSDGNILLDQGQNITQPQATNVVYAPTTQLFFVQGSESVPSQQSIVGGETQTLYGAPVQQATQQYYILPSELSPSSQQMQCLINSNITQDNVSMHIANEQQSIPQTIALPHRNDARSVQQSPVVGMQQITPSTATRKPVQRKVPARPTTAAHLHTVANSKQHTVRVVQPQLCVTSSTQNGQMVDTQAVDQAAVMRQLPQALLQQLLKQPGKFVIKTAQGLTQIKVQSDGPAMRTVGPGSQMRAHSAVVGSHVPQASVGVKVPQNTLALQQLPTPMQGPQNATAYQVQPFPICTQVQQGSPNIQIQQSSPAIHIQQSSPAIHIQHNAPNIQIQQNTPAIKIQHNMPTIQNQQNTPNIHIQRNPQRSPASQVSAVKVDYSLPQMRTKSNLNAQKNQIVTKVPQSISHQLKLPSSALSITTTNAGQAYLPGKQQAQLSNTSGGYVVQGNKRIAGQSITIANASILFQCVGCKSLLDKVGKCPKCGGEQLTRVLTASAVKPAVSRADSSTPVDPQALAVPRTSSQGELINQRSDVFNMCAKCGKLSQNKTKCEHCNQIFLPNRYKPVTSSSVISNMSGKRIASVASVDSSATSHKFTSQNLMVNACQTCGMIKDSTMGCPKCEKSDQSIQPTSSTELQPMKESIVLEPLGTAGLEEKPVCMPSTGRGKPKATTTSRSKGRAKGKRRVPDEPVILTLSSDDDSEEKKELKKKNAVKIPAAPIVLHPKEPIIKSEPTHPLDCILLRLVTQPLNLDTGTTYAALQCRNIRIGSYRTVPAKKVIFSVGGIHIVASPISRGNPPVSLLIPTDRIFKILVHFGASLPVFFLYVKPQLAACIRYVLGLNDPSKEYFDPCSKDESQKRITIVSEKMNEEAKKLMKYFYKTPHRVTNSGITVPMLEEIPQLEAHTIFHQSSIEKSKSSSMINTSLESKSLLVFPPKHKGAVTITIDDYNCLEEEQFLNDVIIDFYLKWLVTSDPTDSVRARTHVFSTFFYKRLTARPGKGSRLENHESDPSLTPAQRRHARVKSWTKGVDIFQKDFIIVPINEHSHWFLAMICFPGLNGIVEQQEEKKVKQKPKQKNKRRMADHSIQPPLADSEWSDRDEASGDEEEVLDFEEECEEEPSQKVQKQNSAKSTIKHTIKQPCILIFDSLRGSSRNKILATLREYLTVEYRQRRGAEKAFNKDTMKGGVPMVPQQTNLSDCGLYTLHFAESFFERPIASYKLPIKSLVEWFPQEDVCKKREDIARLIKSLMDQYRPNHGITLPTLFQHTGPETGSPAKAAQSPHGAANGPANLGHVSPTASQPQQAVSDNLAIGVDGSELIGLPSEPAASRRMQPEIIRDSETSEVLLIVNPTAEPSATKAAADEATSAADMVMARGVGTHRTGVTINQRPVQNLQFTTSNSSAAAVKAAARGPNAQLRCGAKAAVCVPNVQSVMPPHTTAGVQSVAAGGSGVQLAALTTMPLPQPTTATVASAGCGTQLFPNNLQTPAKPTLRTYGPSAQQSQVGAVGRGGGELGINHNLTTPAANTHLLLNLAEIAASQQRHVAGGRSSGQQWSATLPPMTAVLSRGVSSGGGGCGLTVSSQAVKGSLSSSRVADSFGAVTCGRTAVTTGQLGCRASSPPFDTAAATTINTACRRQQVASASPHAAANVVVARRCVVQRSMPPPSVVAEFSPAAANVAYELPLPNVAYSSPHANDVYSSMPTIDSSSPLPTIGCSSPLSGGDTVGGRLLATRCTSPLTTAEDGGGGVGASFLPQPAGDVNIPSLVNVAYGTLPATVSHSPTAPGCASILPLANMSYHTMQPAIVTHTAQATDFSHITPQVCSDTDLSVANFLPSLPPVCADFGLPPTGSVADTPQVDVLLPALPPYECEQATFSSDNLDSYLGAVPVGVTHPPQQVQSLLDISTSVNTIVTPSLKPYEQSAIANVSQLQSFLDISPSVNNIVTPSSKSDEPSAIANVSQLPQMQATEICAGSNKPKKEPSSSLDEPSPVRINSRCGRTIATPKRYLDYAELPKQKKRAKSKKG